MMTKLLVVVDYQNDFVDGRLCASFNDELHEKALDVIESLQVKVINRK